MKWAVTLPKACTADNLARFARYATPHSIIAEDCDNLTQANFGAFQDLTSLCLHWCGGALEPSVFDSLARLQVLSVQDSRIHESAWESITALTTLTTLDLTNSEPHELRVLDALSELTNLTSLNLSHWQNLGDTDIHYLVPLKHLKLLDVGQASYLSTTTITLISRSLDRKSVV